MNTAPSLAGHRPLPAPTSPGSAPPSRSRIEALDLVRLLAIVGMVATHLLAPLTMSPDASGAQVVAGRVASILAEGTSSTLFAVVGGGSLVLAAQGRLAAGDRRGAVLAGLVRGALVAALGLLLGFLPTSVTVVLVPFGAGMMLTAPLLLARSRVLAAVAALLVVVGGPLDAMVRGHLGIVQDIGSVSPLNLAEPFILVRGLLLTGMYPLITWMAYLLVGVVLLRSLLRAARAQRMRRWSITATTVGAGAAALALVVSAVVGAMARRQGVPAELVALGGFGAPVQLEPWAMLVASPHTGSPADMVATAGISVALIGVTTWVLPPVRHLVGTVPRLLQGAGSAPLTIYTIHVVLTAVALIVAMLASGGQLENLPWYVAGPGIFALHLAVVLGLGALLVATGRRGPLEALVSGVVRKAVEPRRLRRGRRLRSVRGTTEERKRDA